MVNSERPTSIERFGRQLTLSWLTLMEKTFEGLTSNWLIEPLSFRLYLYGDKNLLLPSNYGS